MTAWILTYTGRKVHPLDLQPEEVAIEDIAGALSKQCRFTGHTKTFYSVAQHCVEVSHHAKPEDALWGLLHDASEAYLQDFARPLKYADEKFSAFYRELEQRAMRAICARFGLPAEQPDSVTEADSRMLLTEYRDLMPQHPDFVGTARPATPYPDPLFGWTHKIAERMYLMRFERLANTEAA